MRSLFKEALEPENLVALMITAFASMVIMLTEYCVLFQIARGL